MMEADPSQPNAPYGADSLTPEQRAQLQQQLAAMAAAFPRMSLSRMAFWLLLYPRKALLCTRINRQWGRALLLVILTALVFAIADNLRTMDARRAGAAQRNKDILEAFAETVPQVSYLPDSKKFTWGDDKSALPRSVGKDTIRLDIVAASQEITDQVLKESPQRIGLILSNYEIILWLKPRDSQDVIRQNQTDLLATFLLDQEKKNGTLVLSRQVFMDDVLKPLLSTCSTIEGPVLIFAGFISHLGDALSLFFYAFVLMFFLRKFDHGTFKATFSTALAFIFPPLLIGNLLLAILPESRLEDNTVFAIAYFAYLILVSLDRSILFRHAKRQ